MKPHYHNNRKSVRKGKEKKTGNELLLVNMSTSAPMTMRMAWMKSVQMTAESPPKMVKKAARASRMRMEVYRPHKPDRPKDSLMKRAPAYRSA